MKKLPRNGGSFFIFSVYKTSMSNSLLVAFDDLNARGNKFIYDYLSKEFKTRLLDNSLDYLTQIADHRDGVCVFTTSPDIAQTVCDRLPTFLYINDPNENFGPGDMASWKQNMSFFKNLAGVYVTTSALATAFLTSYRTPCRVQYPYVPPRDQSSREYVLYNKAPQTLEQMKSMVGGERFKELEDAADLAGAKLYCHIPEPGEQWNLNLVIAHSYGVPCVTFNQGCFSEFCTGGDKLIPAGDSRAWNNNFKIALRDSAINAKIVYDMSQRFNSMSDLHDKIKKVLKQSNVRGTKQPTFVEAQQQAANVEALKRLQNRKTAEQTTFVQKIVRPVAQRNTEWDGVYSYLAAHSNIYAGVGGIGDALITLAISHKDPNARIIFGVSPHAREFVSQLFKTYGTDALVVGNFNGTPQGQMTWNLIFDHPNVKSCGHIPKDLNYSDWNDSQKYVSKLVTRMPFIQKFGKMLNMRNTKRVVGLSPRGSEHVASWKQRFLSKDEYNRVIAKLLTDNVTVMVFGSEADLNHYGVYPDNNVIFMNSNFAVSHPAPKYPVTMRHMLSCINGCDEIISVDTWLKTYAGLAGIPCKVIMNRHYGVSRPRVDVSEDIFLNPLWGFDLVPLESLL